MTAVSPMYTNARRQSDVCQEAERSERQSTSKSDAKCKDKTHDWESGTAADMRVSCKAPPNV